MPLLTTLTAVKTWIGLDTADTSQDDLLKMILEGVSAEIEGYCNRNFEKSDYTMDFEGYGQKIVMLDEYPVIDLSIVQVMSDENSVLTGWSLDKNSGIIKSKTGWNGLSYQADYTAGYVLPGGATEDDPKTLPSDIESACLQLVGIAYNKRGSEHLATEVVGPLRSEFLKDMPQNIREILDKYKKPVMV